MQNFPLAMTLQAESAPITDQGRKRSNNEDWVTGFEPIDPDEVRFSGSLYIVADGVGGASKGERASRYAAQKVLYEYYQYPDLLPEERLNSIIRKACKDIYQFSIENGTARMATTMVAAVVRGDMLTIANVGDSRGYLIRDGQVSQITIDHNQADELVRNGTLTAEEAKYSKTRNKLTRSLGGEPHVKVDIFKDIQLFPDDLILLCSDGLTRYATDEDILSLSADGNPEEIAKKMIEFANQAGGADNVTVYAIEIKAAGEQVSRAFSGHSPEPVDWDTIQTQSGEWNAKQGPERIKKKIKPIILYSLIGIVGAIIITGSIISSLKKGRDSSLLVSTGPVLSTEFTVPPILEDPTPIFTLTATPELIMTMPALSEDYPAPVATVLMDDSIVVPIDIFVCIHQIQAGEFISSVFEQYSPLPTPGEPFYQFYDCDFVNMQCTGPEQVIEDIDNIAVGVRLKIPGVAEENCMNVKNSYWVTINNP